MQLPRRGVLRCQTCINGSVLSTIKEAGQVAVVSRDRVGDGLRQTHVETEKASKCRLGVELGPNEFGSRSWTVDDDQRVGSLAAISQLSRHFEGDDAAHRVPAEDVRLLQARRMNGRKIVGGHQLH